MKKITFILFALIAGTTFAQDADATANVDALIVQPIQIKVEDNMNFGSIVSDGTLGTVVLSANSDGFADATSTASLVESTRSAALFLVKAANTYGYSIALPTSVSLINGTKSMSLSDFNSSLGLTSVGTGSDQLLYVGGTLEVAADQAEGAYAGDVKVTVAYE
jgi:spore coat protein U-like protein